MQCDYLCNSGFVSAVNKHKSQEDMQNIVKNDFGMLNIILSNL
jgi:hypothetical protein